MKSIRLLTHTFVILLTLFVVVGSERETPHAALPEKTSGTLQCGKCDYIVKGYHNDGNKLNIRPGQVICFDASMTYKTIKLSNIKGTPENPVIIRNCGGVANITEGLRFEHCENFKLVGDGSADDRYGIKVSTSKSFFIAFEMFTTDFEVARIEVAGYNKNGIGEGSGFAGMGVKTSPYQDCKLFTDSTRQAWIMRNVHIHDNWIHDTGGEGMYIGHGFYSGRKEKRCNFAVKTWSHSIKGLRLHHNLVENTGWDGIQIKNADEDTEVYNNIIRNYGTLNHKAHNEGLMLCDGVTGKAYNNLIDTGTGHGIMFQGMGNNDVFNNIILNAGEDGFNGTGSSMGIYLPDGYVRIFNNTIYNSGKDGFTFFNSKGGEKLIMNNLVIKAGRKLYPKGAKVTLANNIFTQDSTLTELVTASLKPVSCDVKDVFLLPYEKAINNGTDVRKYLPDMKYDFFYRDRPRGKGFDIGAIEFE